VDDDVLLVSRKGQAIRFGASDDQLRPMGRATSGVTGMKFRGDDALLSMTVIDADMPEDDRFVFTVTDGGFAKRTAVSEYREQNRGGLGIKAMKLNEDLGSLVGGLVVSEGDEVIAMKTSGQITRSKVTEVPVKGRDTMGVKFVLVKGDDSVAAIARYPEADVAEVEGEVIDGEVVEGEVIDGELESSVDVESAESGESADEVSPETPADDDTE
jgi:DNA gyrase subunit A